MSILNRIEAQRLPSWHTIKDARQYHQLAKQGKVPFRGRVRVEIVQTLKGEPPDFGGTWSYSPQGDLTIYIQRTLFDSAERKSAWWFTAHLVQHEYIEAKLAVQAAKKEYPGRNPYIMVEQDPILGGMAHAEAVRELDGMSENEYDQNIQLENAFLRTR